MKKYRKIIMTTTSFLQIFKDSKNPVKTNPQNTGTNNYSKKRKEILRWDEKYLESNRLSEFLL